MKSKTKPKSNTQTHPEHHTGTQHANPHPAPTTHTNPTHHPTHFEGHNPQHNPQHGAHESLKAKTCEEVETGGFGSFDEHMATSNRCTERATEFCNSCAKSLCSVHFDALHRGHDNFNSQSTGHGLYHQ